MNPYWLLRSFIKTPNISYAATTGLESAGEKQLNPTVHDLIENLQYCSIKDTFRTGVRADLFQTLEKRGARPAVPDPL